MKLDYNNPVKSYNSSKALIIKMSEKLNLKFNLTNVFELTEQDKYKLYDKTSDEIIDTLANAAVCVFILNKFEMYEHSADIYKLIKEYFITGHIFLEDSNEKTALEEFNLTFSDIMNDLENAFNAIK